MSTREIKREALQYIYNQTPTKFKIMFRKALKLQGLI